MCAKCDKVAVDEPLSKWISRAGEVEVEEFEEMKQSITPMGNAYSQSLRVFSSAYVQGYASQLSLPMSGASSAANATSPTAIQFRPPLFRIPATNLNPFTSSSASLSYLQLFPVPNDASLTVLLTSSAPNITGTSATNLNPPTSSSSFLLYLRLYPPQCI